MRKKENKKEILSQGFFIGSSSSITTHSLRGGFFLNSLSLRHVAPSLLKQITSCGEGIQSKVEMESWKGNGCDHDGCTIDSHLSHELATLTDAPSYSYFLQQLTTTTTTTTSHCSK